MYSQVPQGIPYQAVARDNQGNPMSNQSVTIQFSLHEASADGQVIFRETHSTSTNSQGLFSLTFGSGVPTVGSFADINWGSGYKFLQVEADFGNGYVDLGTQQLMSVPYALYSGASGNSTNSQNSNYYPASDSVLTLVGKMILPNGVYTVPAGEVWEIETLNNWDIYQINANYIDCALEVSAGPTFFAKCRYLIGEDQNISFAINDWSYTLDPYLGGQVYRLYMLPNDYSNIDICQFCESTISVTGSAINATIPNNLNLPVYVNEGDVLRLNGLQASVSKYK